MSIEEWTDVVWGRTGNPTAESEIIALAESGNLTVHDHEGKNFKPVRVDEDRWQLLPIP